MSKLQISTRASNLPMSAVRKLTAYANACKAEGVKIYHLNIGDPDVKTPKEMLDVLGKWEINPIRYAASVGEPVFLTALEKYYQNLGYKFIDTKHIIATIGGSEALLMAFFMVAEVGEEILSFEPFFSNYQVIAATTGTKIVGIPTHLEEGFHLPSEKVIEKYITPKTKAILYTSPNNPTGTVYTEKEVRMLVDIAKKHNLFLLSDEVYREFIFSGVKHSSLLDYFKEIPEKAILLDSLSKRYGLCGARQGILISMNEDVILGVTKMAQSRLSGSLIDQVMAAKMTDVPESYLRQTNIEYHKRRDYVYGRLKNMKGVEVSLPEGAFYMMAKLPVKSSEEFCVWLLTTFRDKNQTLMLAPAPGFYATPGKGESEIRIAYVLNLKDLDRAMDLLEMGLEAYKK